MKRALLCLLLPLSAAAERVPTTLSMRGEADFDGHAGRGIPFADQLADLEVPTSPRAVPLKPKEQPAGSGRRTTLLLDRLFDAEMAVSVGARSAEAEPRLRVDISEVLDLIPELPGRRSFLVDVAVIQGITAAGVFGGYGIGKAVGYDRMAGPAERMVEYTREHGQPFGVGGIDWKDPNYGDPWVNNLAHPANFYMAAKYYRKRGYGFWKALAGGTIASVMWEFLWENGEIPKSGHDLLFMNLLGSIAGSHDDLGLAWGVSPLRFDDARGHYTEFYYRPKGEVWRVYFRSEPNGHYTGEGKLPKEERPLFVNDYSLGAGHDGSGLSFWVTGVTDTKPRDLGEVHGPSDVLDDVRLGVSVDLLKHLPAALR